MGGWLGNFFQQAAQNTGQAVAQAGPAVANAAQTAAPTAAQGAIQGPMLGPATSPAPTIAGVGPGSVIGGQVEQMQAGPMSLGPGRTQPAPGMGMSPGPDPEAEGFWGKTWDFLNTDAGQGMVAMLGGARVDNPPPQHGPRSYNRAPANPNIGLGDIGLTGLVKSFGG